ncbi:AcrR family transcriptional regulator [Kineosphaera limosa]|uniref:Putative TetR family transcriptional regulator n=1 Tax=Kineosphaera limosa NBRC 100340 TaxID=1184609 RepID=K6VKU4_9MICO|nr:TetR family transcriptional regulator [Kineosphaera limosa]NYE00731.1 AcrR family transcriptional regulator [Kineosphaera limosa]GAB96818.1 putative TetR family transcriptional regulator [Kineosphaera limosa NBRC 100340]
MPRIAATTVREHRAAMEAALLDAAEELLLETGTLTIAQVAERVGLSRNGVYKYVHSNDDLIEAVAAQHLPRWSAAVTEAMEAADSPRAQVLGYVRANLAEAVGERHSWRVALSSASLSEPARARIAAEHAQVGALLRAALAGLEAPDADLMHRAIQGLLSAGLGALDAGEPLERVSEFTTAAVDRLLPPDPAA